MNKNTGKVIEGLVFVGTTILAGLFGKDVLGKKNTPKQNS